MDYEAEMEAQFVDPPDDLTYRKVTTDEVNRRLARVVNNIEHRIGLTYTDGAGNPVCIIGQMLALMREGEPLTWPDNIELASFANRAVQDWLILEFNLEFVPAAIAYCTVVQARADDGVPWPECL